MNPTKIKNINSFDTIYIHEDHYDWLMRELRPYQAKTTNEGFYVAYLQGVTIHAVKNIPKWVQKWEFPSTPFVEYDKSDESWAIPVKFGRYVDTDEPVIYCIDTKYLDDFIFKPLRNLNALSC